MTAEDLIAAYEAKAKHRALVTQARWAALLRLTAKYRSEYNQWHAEEREARGLPPLNKDQAVDALKERIRELEALLREAA